MTEPAPSDPTGIVEKMQTLTDIEGDLADTIMAVAAPSSAPDLDLPTEEGSSDAMMQNTEAMESVLEQSIPPAPDPATKEEDIPSPVQPRVNDDVSSSPIDHEPSAAAHEASTALSAVSADLNVPVLPESVISAAHDVAAETAVEEESGNIVVEVEQPTIDNITKAVASGEGLPDTISSKVTTPPSVPNAVPMQAMEAPGPGPLQITSAKLSAQTPYASIQAPRGEVSLPQGLSESSPSVLAMPDLVRSWRLDPKNANIVLAIFDWSVQKTEINDARAWYDVLAVENPTAASPL